MTTLTYAARPVFSPAFRQFQQDVNRLFGTAAESTAVWTPAVDVREFEDRFVLSADLPGVDPSTVEVTVEANVLTVAGDRSRFAELEATQPEATERTGVAEDAAIESSNPPSAQIHRTERPEGRFKRQFTLPESVQAGAASAASRFGVLEITVPKVPVEEPRRIQVAVSQA